MLELQVERKMRHTCQSWVKCIPNLKCIFPKREFQSGCNFVYTRRDMDGQMADRIRSSNILYPHSLHPPPPPILPTQPHTHTHTHGHTPPTPIPLNFVQRRAGVWGGVVACGYCTRFFLPQSQLRHGYPCNNLFNMNCLKWIPVIFFGLTNMLFGTDLFVRVLEFVVVWL